MTIEEKKLKVYKSSAGSGKTTTLSIEYLKLALGTQDAFKHILALTFTNKAAQEMKERILEYLNEMIVCKKNPPFYFDELLNGIDKYKNIQNARNKAEAAGILRNDARKLYRQLLHHYSEYAVTTLDSFTNRLIRSFSHDLGLSFNYQVELNGEQLLKDAVDELMNRIGAQEDLITNVLTNYSKQKIDDERSRNIRIDLEKRAQSLLRDVDEEYLKPLRLLQLEDVFEVQKRIHKDIALFKNTLQAFGEEFVRVCQLAGIEAKMFYQGASSIYPYFKRFKVRDFTKKDQLLPNSHSRKIIETGNWTSKTAPQENKDLIATVADRLTDIYQSTQTFLEDKRKDYLLLSQMKKEIFPYMVLIELESILDQIKAENQLVHISDFNKIISDKIANETAPYIYERIGNKYHHYLLDEFQDTSVIQWHNLLPLVENALSENHFNLIVGDAKQSIYRWRGSDVEQFANFPDLKYQEGDSLSQQREQALRNAYQVENLDTNYRSGKAIVDFNNDIFQFIVEQGYVPKPHVNVYDDIFQKAQREDIAASVEVHLLLPEGKKKEVRELLFHNRTVELINQCVTDGYEYKDIAILARGNKLLHKLAQLLLEEEIPVVSGESLFVESSQLVQLVLSLLRYIEKPLESVYQVEIIRHLYNLEFFKNHQYKTLTEHLAQLSTKDELNKYWTFLNITLDRDVLKTMEVYDIVEALVRSLSLNTKDALLHFFIEASFIFTQEKHQDIFAFLEWWNINHNDYKLDVPEELNAVKLMSFHKSKGLQFPVVINWFSDGLQANQFSKNTIWLNPKLSEYPEITSFPFTVSSLKETNFEEVYQREKDLARLDDINLFYVANTRPKEKLFLLMDIMPPDKKSTSDSFRYDLMIKKYLEQAGLKKSDDEVYGLQSKAVNKDDKKKCSIDKPDNWLTKIESIETQNWRNVVTLAIDTGDNEWNDATAWGQKTHQVLSEINTIDESDNVFRRLVYQGVIDEDEQNILRGILDKIVAHEKLEQYYQKGVEVYNEREIVLEGGKIYRPDRMVVLDGEMIIIDYKTGQPTEANVKQVQKYMQLASEVSHLAAKGFLVYLHDDVIVEEVVA